MESLFESMTLTMIWVALTFPFVVCSQNLFSISDLRKPVENRSDFYNVDGLHNSLPFTPDAKLNVNAEVPILNPNCTRAFETLSEATVDFTRCTMRYARPVQICMKCSKEYEASEKAYNELKAQPSDCQQYFFSSDQLGVVDIVYRSGKNLWLKSYCQNCYSNLNLTLEFFEQTKEFNYCIANSNQSIFASSNRTCVECRPIFTNLSTTYHSFVQGRDEFDISGEICMDIVDSMNISRDTWVQFKCSVSFNASLGVLNILTSLIVGTTPVLFYLMAKNISKMEDVKLVRPKRKSTTLLPPDRTIR